MSTFVHDAMSLIEEALPREYPVNECMGIIRATPQGIVESANGRMKLYAQTVTGNSKQVNMRSPALIRELKRLAQGAEGATTYYNDIKWRFIFRELLSLL